MINKKLDDILQNISILKDIFNNNEYFKKIEEATEMQNKWNNELVEKVNNLQSKIDKAIEYIENYYIFDEQNGEYYQTHNFDKSNAKELHDILKEE